MRISLFYHSLFSDWNHGNAHFLRGVATELALRGHEVMVYEPRDSWSLSNLVKHHGVRPIRNFHSRYPLLAGRRYRRETFALDRVLENADIVIVHEWNDPSLVKQMGDFRRAHGGFRLYFHDTHHRMVTEPGAMAAFDLANYDGVLAYGQVLKALYEGSGRVARAWIWHEAADTRVFHPMPGEPCEGDLVWVGNWGDEERTAELEEFLIEPVRALKLRSSIHGVRYPEQARAKLAESNIEYRDWLPNFEVPSVFARYKMTVHIPRRPYVEALPGIPTIRPFEALACAIPLVCSPWDDCEKLFTAGKDYLVARNGREMQQLLRDLHQDEKLRRQLSAHGLQTIHARHTCAHRVKELLSIDASLTGENLAEPFEHRVLAATESKL